MLDTLVSKYLQSLAKLLYPECVGAGLDSHRSHVVHYIADGNPHYDNAEVTLNVALGKNFADGELYFGEMKDVSMAQLQCAHHYSTVGATE